MQEDFIFKTIYKNWQISSPINQSALVCLNHELWCYRQLHSTQLHYQSKTLLSPLVATFSMSTIPDKSPAEFSGLTMAESSMSVNNLMNVLQNLTSNLSRLTQGSEAQTTAPADLKEDLLHQDDTSDEEHNIDKQQDSGDITAAVNSCTLNWSKKKMVSDGHSSLEAQSQKNTIKTLIQVYQPNTKKSSAIKGKIAELTKTLLMGGLSANTAKENTKKYTPQENIKFLSVSSVNEEVWDLLPWHSWMMNQAFQKVQEALLPGLSVLCALTRKLIVSINSSKMPNARETLTTIMDSVALLCHTHLIFKNSICLNISLTDEYHSFELMDFHLCMVHYVKILLVYRPPGLSMSLFLEEFSKLLEHITTNLWHKRLLIVGDFNNHVDNSNDATARQFLDFLDSFDFVQHVREKTHANGHTLDLVISNAMDHFVNNIKTTDPVISDHLAVHSTLHLEKPRFVKKVVSSRNLRRIDMNSFRSDIESSVLLQHQDDLHVVVNNYDEVLRSLLDKLLLWKNELSLSVHLHPGIQLKSLLRRGNEDNLNLNGEHQDSLLTAYVMYTNVTLWSVWLSLLSQSTIRLLLKKTLVVKNTMKNWI